MPDSARTTGTTRLRQLGYDIGPPFPLHFVVEGDHHLALDGVFLHRTVKMPPCDDAGVTVEAAFVAYCADVRLIDAIEVGCFLLHKEWMHGDLLDQLLTDAKWRRGAPETAYALPFLDDRPRSMPEAVLLAYVVFSGLLVPEVNLRVEIAPGVRVTPDQWFGRLRAAVEYEGGHHQDDRAQYNADIDRYADYRKHDVAYELVTKERMRTPKTVIRKVHSMLVSRGYDGPPPDFDETWDSLFRPLQELVRPRTRGKR
ncbi:hypothetical protein [Nocardioides hwasunensis]|uniref:DUF559 domain-containing protein n=1 Tax=Nocardioides hwasunensis TaxID=397258 RepID=A0ABR8MF32_9ACTN|nr:hypothetical protein [Nocardioides hwasunensis]MBD3914170.1 hypothetical protein [Nocardioides hwasunensis]